MRKLELRGFATNPGMTRSADERLEGRSQGQHGVASPAERAIQAAGRVRDGLGQQGACSTAGTKG
jgi:hypothetical protein